MTITYQGAVFGPRDPYWGESAEVLSGILGGAWRRMPSETLPLCDVREVAALNAALLKPGCGPRRYVSPTHCPTPQEVLEVVSEVTGRRLKLSYVPALPVLSAVRAINALQTLLPLRFPIAYAGLWYVTRNNRVDDLKTRRDFGLSPRPLAETFADMLRWMASTGKMDPKVAGKLAA